MNSSQTIPDEVLQHVFNYLTTEETLQTMTSVNSLWSNAAYNSILSLSFVGNYSFEKILKNKKNLEHLKILSKHMNDETFFNSTNSLGLKTLTVASCSMLNNPTISFRKLEDLSMTHCQQLLKPIIDCNHLKNINFTNSSGFNEKLIQKIVKDNQKLKAINLCQMIQLKSLSLESKSIEYLNLNNSKNLTSLKLSCPLLTFLDLSFTKITDQDLEEILFSAKQLKVLRLKGCHELKNPKIEHEELQLVLLDHSKNLENLKLKCGKLTDLGLSFTRITDITFTKILECNSALKSINVQKCINLEYPRIYSDSLENLNFHGSWNIQEPHIRSPKLKSLILNWTQVTDATVRRIVSGCPELNSLEMKICDELVSPLIESATLAEVEFQGSQKLQSPILDCKNLSKVGFEDCISLDASVTDNPVYRKLMF